jgi:hypothetical protein
VRLRRLLLRVHWLLAKQFGLDFVTMAHSLRGIPRYVRDLARFRAEYQGPLQLVPCLHDWAEEAGSIRNEYFWQDLLVARMVFKASPSKHVDVGSRIDGFVAHVASFREIEVFDVRQVAVAVPGVKFTRVDLTVTSEIPTNYCDSLSCLHALEHFGLGRYGDRVDVRGLDQGLTNLARLLKENGLLYLSVPIGIDRVEFNANRVCDPRKIVQLAAESGLLFIGLTVVYQNGRVGEVMSNVTELARFAEEHYALGLFTFVRRGGSRSGPSASERQRT